MRVANVDGLVTLFYDGTKHNAELEAELYSQYSRRGEINGWEEWEISDKCKQYFRERLSWQQVIVVEGVTVIQQKTFQCCFNIKKVIFADSVVRIEYCAFRFCKSLVYIKLPINLEYIDEGAFQECNLSSVFLPPRCRQVGGAAFSHNANLTIVHVPQAVELRRIVFAKTSMIADSPFGVHVRGTIEEVKNWMKNINSDERFSLHRACCSFQPLKEVIFTILEEKGIGAFKLKNEMGITPSQYLKENPYTDISEKDIIEEYVMKMMG
ncbi:hypothetical protein CTEN210_14907 [Chaetoceros tenuissimus]|uniref:Leucine-rich repeat domain-containing protein n=1 Tax=Chaetoceros tenuissimus TaxID=426638 RepID=A0AAD3D846_9STRA|nr:hypothetical protein CTEN210_14907 [Chaetoceros tenuissimus]